MLTFDQARSWYKHVDIAHDFSHIERVFKMSERLAQAEGADLEIVHAAALLHDVEGTTPGSEARNEHHLRSAEFAERVLLKEGWPEERIRAVQHCVRAHRFRGNKESPTTIEAKCIFDAENLDLLGAIGATRTIAYTTLVGAPLYVPASQQFVETGREIPGEPHSAYHEHILKLQKIEEKLFTQTAKEIAKSRGFFLNLFFEQLIAEINGER